MIDMSQNLRRLRNSKMSLKKKYTHGKKNLIMSESTEKVQPAIPCLFFYPQGFWKELESQELGQRNLCQGVKKNFTSLSAI